jgi:hypothetical protein
MISRPHTKQDSVVGIHPHHLFLTSLSSTALVAEMDFLNALAFDSLFFPPALSMTRFTDTLS